MKVTILFVASLLMTACSAAITPKQLKDARDAYAQAQKSIAVELAPAQLETAKQALEKAEARYESEGDDEGTNDLAYIAQRKVELAVLEAQIEQANRERQGASKERSELTEERLSEAESELSETERALGEKDRELRKGAVQLAAERRAREEAEKKAAAALASLSEVAKVKEESRGVVITLSGSVLFATGKFTLLPIARTKLDEVATALKESGFRSIVVEGHTDSRGGDTANEVLSLRRAEAVRAHLVSQGIPSDKIQAVGKGESTPVATNETADGRANNRRVELVVQRE
jgi:outer membrane protein OmpA-like peptidoglycan-associated protein